MSTTKREEYSMSTRRKSRSAHNDQARKRRRLTPTELCGSDDDQQTGSGTLACHFYKRFPTHFTRCLFRHHLTSTSFVVQHIHRCHSRPLRCPICDKTFDCGRELDEHIRQRTCRSASCDRVCTDSGREGLDEHQMVELRKRTSRRGLTEAERWYAIWDFIFPASPRPDSPYIRSPQDEILGITRQAIKIVCPGGNSRDVLNLMTWETVSSVFEKTSPDGSPSQASMSSQTSDEFDGVPSPGPPPTPKMLGSPSWDLQSCLLESPHWDSRRDLFGSPGSDLGSGMPEYSRWNSWSGVPEQRSVALQPVEVQFDNPGPCFINLDDPLTIATDGYFLPESESLSIQKLDQPQSHGENMCLQKRDPEHSGSMHGWFSLSP